MHQLYSSILLFSVFSYVSARAITPRDQSIGDVFAAITPSTSLTWQPCLTSFECAVLDVPLSYTSPNSTRAYVPLLKRPATTTPYKGMILTNPGGPGESAIDFLITAVPQGVFDPVGTNYDVVAWEPRGIGYSMPPANCSISPSSKAKRQPISAVRLNGPMEPAVYFEQAQQQAQALGAECQAVIGGPNGAGPHMSTSVVVKDLISIIDAFVKSPDSKNLTNACLLNYWGFSYGTTVGQTFAFMYPNRVGRVVIDGVVDPIDYVSGNITKELQSTDAAFSTFFIYCHLAGPTFCPFYTGSTASDISTRFSTLLSNLDPNPALAKNWTNATTILSTFSQLKSLSRLVLYTPITSFPTFAPLLVDLETATQNQALLNFTFPDTSITSLPEWLFAVACPDFGNVLFNQTLSDLAANKAEQVGQSYIGGEIWESVRIFCTGWSIRAEERFAGPFGGANRTTRNPILFVSNTRDPITPVYKLVLLPSLS
ncbi:hypothetical protein B0J14DRAFT_361949 [Halenospora varia]|nr:hypothetical protein B0J14DRAFT_361949 [Halenospora varia]